MPRLADISITSTQALGSTAKLTSILGSINIALAGPMTAASRPDNSIAVQMSKPLGLRCRHSPMEPPQNAEDQ